MTTKPKQSRTAPKKKVVTKGKKRQPHEIGARTAIAKAKMIEAMRANLGIVSTSAKVVGIERNAHYTWLKEDPEYKAQIDALIEIKDDFVEGKLYEQINNGDSRMIQYYFDCTRRRGFGNKKQEIELSGSVNIGSLADALKDD